MGGLGNLVGVDWNGVMRQLIARGWARLEVVLEADRVEALEHAARGPWTALPKTEGGAGVHQAGLVCNSAIVEAAPAVRELAEAIRRGLDDVGMPVVAPLPVFNHAQWCEADGGQKYITPHRDPDTAGGVIAVVTIRGRAVFRVWDLDGSLDDAKRQPERSTEWDTQRGDIVLLQGGGWPRSDSRCPIHEAESPIDGERLTLTLRHNKGGYGADYFT